MLADVTVERASPHYTAEEGVMETFGLCWDCFGAFVGWVGMMFVNGGRNSYQRQGGRTGGRTPSMRRPTGDGGGGACSKKSKEPSFSTHELRPPELQLRRLHINTLRRPSNLQ